MHVHFVLAHPEPQSFNAHLVRVGMEAVGAAGGTTSVSDLYAIGFDPCERPEHYAHRSNDQRFDVQSEQRHASETKSLPPVVLNELAALDRADVVILQYPMWWHLPPAILKGYFDRVFAYGEAYTSCKRFEHGRFAGKKALLSVTVGTSRETYMHDGRSGDINLMLWPVNFTLSYVGFEILSPFIAYGVEGGLRYSEGSAIEQRLEQVAQDFRGAVASLGERPVVPFNRMAEWGADGRLKPDAPIYSAYMRRKRDLELE